MAPAAVSAMALSDARKARKASKSGSASENVGRVEGWGEGQGEKRKSLECMGQKSPQTVDLPSGLPKKYEVQALVGAIGEA